MTDYSVEIQPDFLERQARAQPVAALAELIWNSLDADATEVKISLKDDGLGGLSQIVVRDNGVGIPHPEAPTLFRYLGGSWKKHAARTKLYNRELHGQEGRGRFKAFALGSVADWQITYRRDNKAFQYAIGMVDRDIRRVQISNESPAETVTSTGVTLTIRELKRNFVSLRPESSLQELAEIFALYLKNYGDVLITVDGHKIDPVLSIAKSWERVLEPIEDEEGNSHSVSLEVIEWRHRSKRALFLCSEQGFPLSQVESRFHVGDFHFSAYLKSPFISSLHQESRLDLAEMVPALTKAVEEARRTIKELFRERTSERARVVVEDWKDQKVYPFQGDAETQIERAERQIFDIVAVTVQEAAPDLNNIPKPQMALHLRMLRHAIQRSPAELQRILDEVLKLPKRKQKELAVLLDETDLAAIISAATIIADRIKFLHGLRIILFEHEAKSRLKERTQLH